MAGTPYYDDLDGLAQDAQKAGVLRWACDAATAAMGAGWSNSSCSSGTYVGASLLRPGFQALLELALRRGVDVVVAESLDRFSRDQEDIAGFYKRLSFAGVALVTVSEAEINHLHVGLKGTMKAFVSEGPRGQAIVERIFDRSRPACRRRASPNN